LKSVISWEKWMNNTRKISKITRNS
jgi:hypothetical protein